MEERQHLMIPGPTNVDPAVLRALSKPTLSHVSSSFAKIHNEAADNLKKIFMTEGEVLIISGSGTLAQEMAVANIVEPGDKVLVVCNGYFGQRFAEICETHKAALKRLDVPWGGVLDPKLVAEELEQGNYKAIYVVHVDTSTGAANKIREIGDYMKGFDTLYVVDAVCSLGGMEVNVDNWNIDICLTGSQKAIAIPPGLALMALSERAMKAYDRRRTSVSFYYGDFKNWIPVMRDPLKYFATPAVNMVYGLNESLKMILAEGLEKRFIRHRILAKAFRVAVKSIGLNMVTSEEVAADTMTAVFYPERVLDADFRAALANDFNIIVAGGLGQFKGKIFRVGHMGNVSVGDITATISGIELTLRKLDYKVRFGSGLEAAEKEFIHI